MLIAISVAAAAFQFTASTYNVAITSATDGRVYLYARNNASQVGTISFSAQTEELYGRFETATTPIAAGETKGTYFIIGTGGQCLRGTRQVPVDAQLCVGGRCTVETLEISVRLRPGVECTSITDLGLEEGSTDTTNYACYSNGCFPIKSDLYFETGYDPAYREISILGPEETNMYVSSPKEVTLTIVNRGAAGTFDVLVVGDKGRINAIASPGYVSLDRNEQATVTVDATSGVSTGKYCVGVDAVHNGIVLAEKEVCFNVYDRLSARIQLPAKIYADRCAAKTIDAVIQNTGTIADTYLIAAGPYAKVSPASVALAPEGTARVQITVDAEAFALGETPLTVTAKGTEQDAFSNSVAEGSGTAMVQVVSCRQAGLAVGEVGTSQSINGSLVKFVAVVENPDAVPLEGVKATIRGLPNGWKVLQQEPDGITIPPESVANLTLWVSPASGETVDGTLEVKAGQDVVYQKPVRINGSTGEVGLAGFFVVALSQNLLFISVLVLAALLVIVLSARKKQEAELRQAKLNVIKEEVARPA